MSIHYDPYLDADEIDDHAACGVMIGDSSRFSGDWSDVDCKRCLKGKGKIESAFAEREAFIVKQMGHMAEHIREKH